MRPHASNYFHGESLFFSLNDVNSQNSLAFITSYLNNSSKLTSLVLGVLLRLHYRIDLWSRPVQGQARHKLTTLLPI